MADLSVRVLNDDEEPLEDISVGLEFTEITRGMSVTERTDGEGYVYLINYTPQLAAVGKS